MHGLTEEAKEARREYNRAYARKNRERLREYQREWRARNRDKVKQYHRTYWQKKAQEDEEH